MEIGGRYFVAYANLQGLNTEDTEGTEVSAVMAKIGGVQFDFGSIDSPKTYSRAQLP